MALIPLQYHDISNLYSFRTSNTFIDSIKNINDYPLIDGLISAYLNNFDYYVDPNFIWRQILTNFIIYMTVSMFNMNKFLNETRKSLNHSESTIYSCDLFGNDKIFTHPNIDLNTKMEYTQNNNDIIESIGCEFSHPNLGIFNESSLSNFDKYSWEKKKEYLLNNCKKNYINNNTIEYFRDIIETSFSTRVNVIEKFSNLFLLCFNKVKTHRVISKSTKTPRLIYAYIGGIPNLNIAGNVNDWKLIRNNIDIIEKIINLPIRYRDPQNVTEVNTTVDDDDDEKKEEEEEEEKNVPLNDQNFGECKANNDNKVKKKINSNNNNIKKNIISGYSLPEEHQPRTIHKTNAWIKVIRYLLDGIISSYNENSFTQEFSSNFIYMSRDSGIGGELRPMGIASYLDYFYIDTPAPKIIESAAIIREKKTANAGAVRPKKYFPKDDPYRILEDELMMNENDDYYGNNIQDEYENEELNTLGLDKNENLFNKESYENIKSNYNNLCVLKNRYIKKSQNTTSPIEDLEFNQAVAFASTKFSLKTIPVPASEKENMREYWFNTGGWIVRSWCIYPKVSLEKISYGIRYISKKSFTLI